ncbi:MAG: YhcH/YjgK/YiaL family protein [Bullifex sp.]
MIFDTLDNMCLYEKAFPFLREIREFLEKVTPDLEKGCHVVSDTLRYNAAAYTTCKDKKLHEIHRKEVDVQIIFSGEELIKAEDRAIAVNAGPYDSAGDASMVEGGALATFHMKKGHFVVFLPGEPHMPGIAVTDEEPVRKVIFKVAFN